MKFAFIVKHRNIWPVAWLCEALDVSRSERLMRENALLARPRRRGLPKDDGQRLANVIAPNVLDRQFSAERPNQK